MPSGEVRVSSLVQLLLEDDDLAGIASVVDYSKRSHIIEVELPFLQRTFNNFTIVPIVFGSVTDEEMFFSLCRISKAG